MAEWQEEIDRVFAPVDRLSRLVLRWEAGDRWQPIQRFIIWQCEDPNTVAVPPVVRHGLRGPHPRSKGHYCAEGYCLCTLDPRKKHTYHWRGAPDTPFDRATWELWHDTRLFGRRWWTIQGPKGGHRFVLDPGEYEAKILQMKTGFNQTPDPGDLAFADFDGRVLEKIAAMDKVRAWTGAIDYAARNVDVLDKEHLDLAVAAREKLWQWMDYGIDEAWEIGGSAFKQHLRDTVGRAKPGTRTNDVDYEAVEHEFLHNQWD